ncbi:DNA double-strand break repair nuclease NurA [Halopiger aswanensis]|uniref:NurA domain-containing protein n=1 Tax=Halopiger aswanensis TaxID=148449 RepID=A0A3R7HV80_9EURY|nr:DNA double-strand break repair nuclease NurA [Halopiger aswanensis]RKD88106.1 NurA domain-containing protein [Halopiger aswanensis]
MTLDPVHFDGIARLAGRIDHGADADDRRAFAETVWEEFLDPLVSREGRRIVEPVDERARRLVDCEDVALRDREFPTEHGLDAGTINPTTFKNGLVIDIAQAAMSATPSDLDLHRARTVVATVHSNDETMTVDETWGKFDEGYSRSRAVKIPPLPRFAEGVVHALALYLAESTHARDHADEVEDLLVLDGPLYPRGLLRWADQHPDLADFLLEDPRPTTVLENYVRLVEEFVDRGVPLIGFVKNPATRVITRTLKGKHDADLSVPWADDSALFTRLLERGEYVDDVEGERWERDTSALTYTNWFRSRGGVDQALSADGDALGVERHRSLEDYEVTFFVVYDPRDDLIYRVEAPYAFTRDPETREALTMQVLQDVAVAHGPPTIVEKADELARISRSEKRSLRESFETAFDTSQDRTYDDHRWNGDGDGDAAAGY